MQIGILGGTGPLGRGLACRLAQAGHSVTVGGRDGERAAQVVSDDLAGWPSRHLEIVGTSNQDASEAELVVVATPWEAASQTSRELAEKLSGKVVISVGNALVKQGRQMHAVIPARGSVAAMIQAALPGSFVSAAGHHLPAAGLLDLDQVLDADVLICSDHKRATEETVALFASIDGIRPVEAGNLSAAGPIEAFTAVLITVNIKYKAHSTLKLGGLN